MFDLFEEITSTLKQNKMRTALTGFAVTWGIFIIIVLLGTGNGLMNALMGNAGSEVKHLITIYPGSTSTPYEGVREGTRVRLSERDLEFFEEFSDKIDKANGSIYYFDSLRLGKEVIPCNLLNTHPEERETDQVPMLAGRFVNQLDMDLKRKCMVVDNEAVAMLFDDEDYTKAIGQHINVGNIPFRLVGVYEKNPNNWGHQAYLPYTTVKDLVTEGHWLSTATLQFHGMETVEENQAFQKDLQEAFNKRRGYNPEDTRTLFFWNLFTSQKEMTKAMGIIRTALWILGFLTLLSGIVGVSNIMLITVKERTREFGIRKALGAKPRSVLGLVVVESVVITAIFGFLGIVFGMLGNWYLDSTLGSHPMDLGIQQIYMFKNIGVGFDVAIKATLLLIVSGTAAGIIPAWKGARVRPIEALRADK